MPATVFLRRAIPHALFIMSAALFVFFLGKDPIYNWDMIAYMGVAVEYAEPDIAKVHRTVYSALEEQVSPYAFQGLTDNYEGRRECLEDPEAFGSQMAFFRTKPLYTFIVFLLHRCGVGLVSATVIPSAVACFLMIILAYRWLCHYLRTPFAILGAAFIALLPVFAELDRYSTPDALSGLFLLASLYLVATGGRKTWIFACLLLAVLARVDNFLFALSVSYFVYLRPARNLLLNTSVVAAVTFISVLGIPVILGDRADWFTSFAFLHSLKDYIQHWRDLLYTFRTDAHYIFLFLLTAYMLWKASSMAKQLLIVIVVTVIFRLLLFPSLQERFFAAYEFAVIILFIGYLGQYVRVLAPDVPPAAPVREL